jgi:hypothetical protein
VARNHKKFTIKAYVGYQEPWDMIPGPSLPCEEYFVGYHWFDGRRITARKVATKRECAQQMRPFILENAKG